MLKVIIAFYERVNQAMGRGVALTKILKLPVKAEIGRMKELTDLEQIKGLVSHINNELRGLEGE
jgi:V/A-type H+-transporting ATPase subunit A